MGSLSVKNDPLLRSPGQRSAISGSWSAHTAARKCHKASCRCPLCSFGGCSTETPCMYCRASGSRVEPAVSLDAIAAKYTVVAQMRSAAKLLLATLQGWTAEQQRERVAEVHGPSFDAACAALWDALGEESGKVGA